jgi:PAS domain S-box-containing protein
MRLIHKGLILVGVPLVLAVLVISCMFGSIIRLDHDRLLEARQRQYADISAEGVLTITDLGDVIRQVIQGHDPEDRKKLKAALLHLRESQEQAQSMPEEYSRDPMTAEVDAYIAKVHDLLSTFLRHGSILGKISVVSDFNGPTWNAELYDIAQHSHEHNMAQRRILRDSAAREQAAFQQQAALLVGAVGASMLVAFGLASWFMKGIAFRLRIMMDNTLRMAAGQKLNPPLGGNDEIAKVDSAFHNVTRALREAMAKEHALFESASDVIMIADGQFNLTSVNPASFLTLGHEAKDLEGKDFLQLVIDEDLAATQLALNTARTAGGQASFENRCKHISGKTIDLFWSVYWSELDGAMYMVAHDISERKQLERVKEEFLSMVSHDLRSPLTSISGTFKLIAAGAFGPLPSTIADKLSGIMGHVDRLLTLVNDLLDMEKLSSGKMALSKQSVSVTEILSKSASEVEPQLRQKQLTLSIECSADKFLLDDDRMLQVLINLLSNAIKFSPQSETIKLTAAESNGDLTIEVIDHGRGIPEEYRLRIFERFKQVESADGKRSQGTGLGLPICKKIVEEHGGTIKAVETPGHGTTFRIVIPASGMDVSPAQATPPLASQAQDIAKIAQQERRRPTTIPVIPEPAIAKHNGVSGLFHLPSFANLKLIHKGIVLVVVPVAFELLFAGCLYPLLNTSFQEKIFETQQWLVALQAKDLFMNVFALGLSRNIRAGTPVQFNSFKLKAAELQECENGLLKLTDQDPQIAPYGRDLASILIPIYAHVKKAKLFPNTLPESDAKAAIYGVDSNFLFAEYRELRPVIQNLIDYAESKGSRSPAKLEKLHKEQARVLLGALIASVLISGISATLFANGLVKRLQVMEENISRLEHDAPLNPPLSGTDELANLDHVFHSMVAALSEARHKERAVFDNSQDVMAVIAVSGKILRVNPACERHWNTKPEDLIGNSIFDLFDPSQRTLVMEAFHAISSGAPAKSIETGIANNGTAGETLLSLSWSESEKNVVAIAHDISHRKELERLKQEFLSMVSHDMRTPLSGIMSNAEMMAAGMFGQLPEKATGHLSAVVRNCERLLNLINDLLDIEKLEAGQMQMNRQSASARSILQRSAESLLSMCEQKHIRIDVQASEDLSLVADADRLVQVVVNLLSNAVKFSPENSVIKLTADMKDNAIEFQVQDQGRGIPESHISAVFERFRQVEAADGKRQAGTGLGLPICKQIVEQHGGTIAVSSRIGEGSTFYFLIPSVKAVVY